MSDEWDEDGAAKGSLAGGVVKVGLLVVVVALAAGVWAFGWSRGPSNAFAGWMTDWDRAVERSKASGKPAVALFTAEWCPACRAFEADALARDDVKTYLRENHTLLVIDLTNQGGPNSEIAARCGVQSIPTLIRYDRAGRETGRSHGMPPDALLGWLRTGR